MSSLALHLQKEGHRVSGSDQAVSQTTHLLERAGIKVYSESESLPEGIARVVISSAIQEEHPLFQQARKRGIEIVHRSAELSRLFNSRQGIAVAGTHGKTTTSTLVTHILSALGETPSAMLGGNAVGYETNTFLGTGPFVAEADESDGSLLAYRPVHAVVTSVDDDVNVTAQAFSQCGYQREKVQETVDKLFLQFAENTEKSLWVCHDHARASALLSGRRGVKSYGVDGGCFLRAETLERGPLHSTAQIYLRRKPIGRLRIPMPGHHNVMNSLAAVGLALDLGLRFADIAHAVAMFRGVERRFEKVGEKSGAVCIDDYAHNPQKVAAALQAARQSCRGRVIALFQPHRFTRMRLLGDSFLPALDGADEVLLTDVYSAGEESNGFEIAEFLDRLVDRAPSGSIHWTPDKISVQETLDRVVKQGDLVISLGAGDCGSWLKTWSDHTK